MKRSVIGLLVVSFVSSQALGRSIEDINPRRLPKVGLSKRLSLSGRDISSLEGINAIRGIESARIINLSSNNLSTLEEGALASAKKLRGLNLSNNQLTGEGLKGLVGLDNLQVLILDANNIETIPQEVLKGLPRLKVIIIRNNPISGQTIKQLRSDGYIVYTLPMILTGANIKRALLVTSAIAVIVLGALGAVEGFKAGKEYVQNQKLAEMLEGSASTDLADALVLEERIAQVKANLLMPEIVRQPLEWHMKFLRQQAEVKESGVMFARNGNMAELGRLLRKDARDIDQEIIKQEKQLADVRQSYTMPAAAGDNIEAYLGSLRQQLEQVNGLLTQLDQESLANEEQAEEERKKRIEEMKRAGKASRKRVAEKHGIQGY